MHLLELLAGVGAAQGLLLLLLIAFRYRRRENLPLALLLLVFSFRLGTIPSWNAATLLADPWLLAATTPLPFLFGPLLWWYLLELASDGEGRPRLLPLHGLPYLLDVLLLSVLIVVLPAQRYSLLVESLFDGSAPEWTVARNGLKVVLNLAYMLMALRLAFGNRGCGSSRSRRIWIRTLALLPFASLVPFAYVALNPGASAGIEAGDTLPFTLVAAGMSLLIYSVSMLVLLRPDAPHWTGRSGRVPGVSEQECEALAAAAQALLAGGEFRDPELSLPRLARRMHVHPNRLSCAINRACGCSFPHLLHTYRLDAFQDAVAAGELERRTILDIALDVGFPSKSTFNRVYKERFGAPPSERAGLQTISR